MTVQVLPNFADWGATLDPDGVIGHITWLLSKNNEMRYDSISKMGNLPLGHRVNVQAGLPQGTYRQVNQGTASTKGLYAQYQFEMSQLVEYSCVDKTIAHLKGQKEQYLWNQTQAAMMGMGQQQATTLLYGNSNTNPSQFNGILSYYNTLNTTTAQTANNIIDMGGTGSSNASILLMCWGDDTNYEIFPEGSVAGIEMKDLGDIRPIYDSNNLPFEGYTTYLSWYLGLAVADWRFNARIANIDTTTAGIAGTNPPDLFRAMSKSTLMIPSLQKRSSGIVGVDSPTDSQPGVNPAFYCNRTIRGALYDQVVRDKNVLLGKEDYDGIAIETYRGVPIRNMDSMLTTEAAITAA